MNTTILWGNYNITKMFNLVSIGSLPDLKPFTVNREMIANGASREVATVSTNLNFTITVSRDGAKASLDTLSDEFDKAINNDTKLSLRITDNTNGEVYGTWQKATLTAIPTIGNLDQAANNIDITWSCTNDIK
jgi:hypothetical protein